MTAPTKASLQRELRAMTKRAEEAEEAERDLASFRLRAEETEEARRMVAREHRETIKRIRSRLRPVLAYFGEQWIGDRVRKEYQELVQFVKGSGDE